MSKMFCLLSNIVFPVVNAAGFYISLMTEILNRNTSSRKKKKG